MPEDFTQADDVQPIEGQGDAAAPEQTQVQPSEGQGQGDATAGLYDLSSVPDEYREHVERIAKDIDRNAQTKFREAADYRKQWQPFEDLGLTDQDPAQIRQMIELSQLLGDESTAQDAVLALAKHVGLEVDGLDEEPEGEPDPNAELRTQVERLAAAESERQQAQAQAQELERLQGEWDDIVQEHGPFTDEQQELIVELASRFDSEDEPLKAAHKLFNQIVGHGEQGLVKAKAGEPRAAEPAGRASTAVAPPETFEEAKRLMTERRAQTQMNAA
jgi:hypothetical protein